MRRASEALVMIVLVALLCGATNLIAAYSLDGGFSALLSTAVSLATLSWALLFLRQKVDPSQSRQTFVEIACSMALLYLPIFLGLYWVAFTPEWLSHMGLTQVSNFVSVLIVFELSLFLTGKQRRRVAILCVFIYTGSVIVDFAVKGLIQSILGARPSGFMANANDGAALLDALLVAALPWDRRTVWGYGLALVALAGVGLTLSRSGLLLWALVVFAYAAHLVISGKFAAKFVTLAATGVAIIGFSLVALAPEEVSRTVLGDATELSRVQSVILLLQGDASGISNDPRVIAFQAWSEKVPEHPFLGHGTDYSESSFGPFIEGFQQPPHNLFLARLVDSGMMGLASLLLFQLFWFAFFLIRSHTAGLVYTGAFMVMCIFSHEMDTLRNTLVLFAFFAADTSVRSSHASTTNRQMLFGQSVPAE